MNLGKKKKKEKKDNTQSDMKPSNETNKEKDKDPTFQSQSSSQQQQKQQHYCKSKPTTFGKWAVGMKNIDIIKNKTKRHQSETYEEQALTYGLTSQVCQDACKSIGEIESCFGPSFICGSHAHSNDNNNNHITATTTSNLKSKTHHQHLDQRDRNNGDDGQGIKKKDILKPHIEPPPSVLPAIFETMIPFFK
eukprot:CAMPEP_0114391514 /NCGR_PEP_ID=MMETSP0102-20121206/10153_1 /TAXON_ID=38822 ORGANISM="Pteridomonas danica, Strain PT" /NCGR_SAMPLE_ID=MMETSP0102 /ASSEMBLY_ACC=CAM_ASM_000212 /LENGTH=191 /DNA_ID=CAMNT_0001550327 /DNA_START=137 /DNA_END=712 /DNA_ORIENTATION=+